MSGHPREQELSRLRTRNGSFIYRLCIGVGRIGARVRKEGGREGGKRMNFGRKTRLLYVYIYIYLVYTRRLGTNWESSIRYERSSFICTASEYRVSRNC